AERPDRNRGEPDPEPAADDDQHGEAGAGADERRAPAADRADADDDRHHLDRLDDRGDEGRRKRAAAVHRSSDALRAQLDRYVCERHLDGLGAAAAVLVVVTQTITLGPAASHRTTPQGWRDRHSGNIVNRCTLVRPGE